MKTKKTAIQDLWTIFTSGRKKYLILFSACILWGAIINAQSQTYEDYRGSKTMCYGDRSGILDTTAQNPAPNKINSKEICVKYTRSGTDKFDYLKLSLSGKLTEVNQYATWTGNPALIKMRVLTTAPVGTTIEIQLAKKGENEYPAGVNSQYQGKIRVRNAWHEVVFKLVQIPKGSKVSPKDIDQLNILFNPNSLTNDIYYFDDVKGPPIVQPKTIGKNRGKIKKAELYKVQLF